MSQPKPRILMYHSISQREPGEFDRQFALPKAWFKLHLDLMQALKLPILPIDSLLQGTEQRGVVLTFDDAYADFGTTAWPLLRARGLPAAVMVPTGHVGESDQWNWDKAPRQRLLHSWAELRALSDQGAAIESHTVSHPDLRTLEGEELDRELQESREAIEREIGRPSRFLAYPFNRTSPTVQAAVARAGYQMALSGHWTDDGRLRRRRYDAGSQHPVRFAMEILGIVDAGRSLKRARKEQLAGVVA